MRPLLFLCLLILISSCGGARKSHSFKMGETTRADIVAELGEPLTVDTPPVENTKVLNYRNGDKYQLKNDILVNRFADPKEDQRSLLWWRHKFRNCVTKEVTLPQDIKAHTPPEVELSCPSEGLSVIYTTGSENISRVVEFEKK